MPLENTTTSLVGKATLSNLVCFGIISIFPSNPSETRAWKTKVNETIILNLIMETTTPLPPPLEVLLKLLVRSQGLFKEALNLTQS